MCMRSSSWFGGAMHIGCSNWLGIIQRRCSNWFRDMYHRGSDWLGAMHVSCASCTMFMKECNGLESILMKTYNGLGYNIWILSNAYDAMQFGAILMSN